MIKTKNDLREYINADNWYYDKHYPKNEQKLFVFLHDPQYKIRKYKLYLRKEEYYLNKENKNKIDTIFRLINLRRKNKLGNMLGILIPPNTFGKGLTIMHHGEVIINPNVKVGDYCILHGGNCIGNNGNTQEAPIIGNNVDIGIGAKVIGGSIIADNCKIGANAVVTHSFEKSNSVIIGIPAKMK